MFTKTAARGTRRSRASPRRRTTVASPEELRLFNELRTLAREQFPEKDDIRVAGEAISLLDQKRASTPDGAVELAGIALKLLDASPGLTARKAVRQAAEQLRQEGRGDELRP